METVHHDGRETAYRRTGASGDGPTILYVHGSGGDHKVWVRQYAPSGPAHPAVALDLSGHGESAAIDTEPGHETMAAYADDVLAVARETDAAILVGNSLGGAVIFEVLLERDFEPAGAVFAGTGAKLAVDASLRTQLEDDFEAGIQRLHKPSMLFAGAEENVLQQSMDTFRETGQAVTRRDFLTCHEFDVRDRLDEISLPALAVVGSQDQLTPPEYHEYLAQNMPDCELHIIDGGAHLLMLERPAQFNNAIASFCSSPGR